MREGHIGKAQEKIRAGKDVFVQSEGPADDEIDGACAGHHQAVNLLGKRHAIQLFAFNGEHDAVFSVPNMGKKPLSLFFLYLLHLGRAGIFVCLFIRYFHDFELTVTTKTLLVFGNRVPVKFSLILPTVRIRFSFVRIDLAIHFIDEMIQIFLVQIQEIFGNQLFHSG